MPAKKPMMKRVRPRRVYRRRYKKRANYSVARTSPISDRTYTRMRYATLTALNYGGLGTPAAYQYRINSLFDPDLTGGGHQPLGFDQYATLYNKYRVHGMKYKITFTSRSTTYQAEVAVQVRPNNTLHTVIDTIFESPYSQKRTLGIEGGRAIATISGYCSVAKIRGVSKSVVKSDDQYASLVTTSPNTVPVLTIYCQNQTSNQAIEVAVRVELEYFCEFFDRKLLTQS